MDKHQLFIWTSPLYAVTKLIQWDWPDIYGEHKLVVMYGPLHIEMGELRFLGKWLEQSEWTNALFKPISHHQASQIPL